MFFRFPLSRAFYREPKRRLDTFPLKNSGFNCVVLLLVLGEIVCKIPDRYDPSK